MPSARSTACLLLLLSFAAGAEPPRLTESRTVVVSADESSEDPERDDVFYFRGHFRLRTPDWALAADAATVYGELEDPELIVAEGGPVQFRSHVAGDESVDDIEGEGQRLEYDRVENVLHLVGAAMLTDNVNVMRSEEIVYDLDERRLKATGSTGVNITVDPNASRY